PLSRTRPKGTARLTRERSLERSGVRGASASTLARTSERSETAGPWLPMTMIWQKRSDNYAATESTADTFTRPKESTAASTKYRPRYCRQSYRTWILGTSEGGRSLDSTIAGL